MKKLFLILFLIISSFSYSQSVKGNRERTRWHFTKKIRKQMHHFDQPAKDQLLKNNGTSYRMNRKLRYKVDGDGFNMPTQGKQNKKKTK